MSVFLITITFTTAMGQHCAFDFAAIIVVNVHEKDSIKNIPNLKITIVDSIGKPFESGQFWQNPSKTTFAGYIDNNNPADPSRIRFPFASDNYVLIIGYRFPVEKYYIKIEEIDRSANGEYYPLIWPTKLYAIDKYSLCGTYDDDYYHSIPAGRIYKPIEIIMCRKQ